MWVCCRQVAPRHKLHTAAEQEAHFALFAFCHDLPSRTAVNSHIVVAGPSDCGLSALETLVLHDRLNFTALTLLAPGGLSTGSPHAHYSPDLLVRLVSNFHHSEILFLVAMLCNFRPSSPNYGASTHAIAGRCRPEQAVASLDVSGFEPQVLTRVWHPILAVNTR